MRTILLILLFSVSAQGQGKMHFETESSIMIYDSKCMWQRSTPTPVIAKHHSDLPLYALQFLSGSADGINQAIAHHHLWQGSRFWDADISWKNKYKNYPTDKRAKFPGSKSVLVMATDGYHLTRFVDRSAIIVSIAVGWRSNWKTVLLAALVNRAAFGLFYNVIFK